MRKTITLIFIVLALIYSGNFLACTKKQDKSDEVETMQEQNEKETLEEESQEPVSLTEEELQGPTGKIFVEAIRNFPLFVIDSKGRKIELGHCNKEWDLPPGTYTVTVIPDGFPEMEAGKVVINENELTKMKVGGFGYVNVKAMALFHGGPRLITEDGEEIELGHCNKEWIVPEGIYTVKVKPERFEEKDLGTITVKEGEVSEVELRGFGWINVKASDNFGGEVSIISADDKVIPLDHCNKDWIVPNGTYKVKVKEKVMKDIQVIEAEVTEVDSGI